MEAILWSVKGAAAHIVRWVGPDDWVWHILEKLETVYGIITSSDMFLQNIYRLVQGKSEKV